MLYCLYKFLKNLSYRFLNFKMIVVVVGGGTKALMQRAKSGRDGLLTIDVLLEFFSL